jgi:general secretion pathway protein E
VFYKPVGCEACAETGYSGRIGIFELLVVDEAIRREVIANSDGKKIARVACSRGMVSLRDDGVRQVIAGRVSIEEILAATHDADIELE